MLAASPSTAPWINTGLYSVQTRPHRVLAGLMRWVDGEQGEAIAKLIAGFMVANR